MSRKSILFQILFVYVVVLYLVTLIYTIQCMMFVSNVNRSFRKSEKESKKVSYFRSTVVVAIRRRQGKKFRQQYNEKKLASTQTPLAHHSHTRILATTLRFHTTASTVLQRLTALQTPICSSNNSKITNS